MAVFVACVWTGTRFVADNAWGVNDSLSQWLVQIVTVGIIGVLGFLARNAFSNLEKALIEVGGEIKVLIGSVNAQHTDVALLQQRLARVESDLEKIKGSL